jgi:hypothetical protein
MLIHSRKKGGLRVLESKGIMVKAVMVYIKVVLKPPSASTQLRSYPGKPKKKYVYQKEQERNKKEG